MTKRIILAGGCFWGIQAYMRRLKGVSSTLVGYANGHTPHPTYEDVCSGTTGYAESCCVEYDPEISDISEILGNFLKVIDPTSLNRQGADSGTQYRTAIFYNNDAERISAEKLLKECASHYSSPVVTAVEPLVNFYPAEEYHQDYLEKNPGGYCHIDLSLLDEKE